MSKMYPNATAMVEGANKHIMQHVRNENKPPELTIKEWLASLSREELERKYAHALVFINNVSQAHL